MERLEETIQTQTDALGTVRRSRLYTLMIRDRHRLDEYLQRLDKSLELAGCANILCHESHWVEEADEGWNILIRSRCYQSLRQVLAERKADQPELICLSSDSGLAQEQLLRYQNRLRLPDEAVIRLGLDICRALENGQKHGLESCQVTADTVYLVGDRWLLGNMGIAPAGLGGAPALASLLHWLLGGTNPISEPPMGAPALRNAISAACVGDITIAQLRRSMERLAGDEEKPEPERIEKRCDEPIEEPIEEPEQDSAFQRLLDALSDIGAPENPTTAPLPAEPELEPSPFDWDEEDADAVELEMPMPVKRFSEVPVDMTDAIRKKVHLATMLSAGDGLTAALRKDGTIVSTRNFAGLDGWRHIQAVAVGGSHLLGLRGDGRVQAVGSNFQNQCDIMGWNNIIQIAAGATHSMGLRSDGRVVVTGKISGGYFHVYRWENIAAIAAGAQHIVGLRSDGTVVAEGSDLFGQCSLSEWRDIVAISAGGEHTVGLRSDGTVVAAGANRVGQCNVESWTDIIAVDAGHDHTVGLRADGTVVATGSGNYGACAVGDWSNIIAISAGRSTTVGLRSVGRLVAVGRNDHNQTSVNHWVGLV